jgi:hypothetical protein
MSLDLILSDNTLIFSSSSIAVPAVDGPLPFDGVVPVAEGEAVAITGTRRAGCDNSDRGDVGCTGCNLSFSRSFSRSLFSLVTEVLLPRLALLLLALLEIVRNGVLFTQPPPPYGLFLVGTLITTGLHNGLVLFNLPVPRLLLSFPDESSTSSALPSSIPSTVSSVSTA